MSSHVTKKGGRLLPRTTVKALRCNVFGYIPPFHGVNRETVSSTSTSDPHPIRSDTDARLTQKTVGSHPVPHCFLCPNTSVDDQVDHMQDRLSELMFLAITQQHMPVAECPRHRLHSDPSQRTRHYFGKCTRIRFARCELAILANAPIWRVMRLCNTVGCCFPRGTASTTQKGMAWTTGQHSLKPR